MANKKHVKVVKQGQAAIATWRGEHPDVVLDLADANLAGTDLSRCDLTGATLRGADLSDCNLAEANLTDAKLLHCSLARAKLVDADGLNSKTLGGSNLDAAELPAELPDSSFGLPLNLREATNYTRHLFWWLLAVCFFCWLSIGATRDVELIVNQGRLVLPVFGVAFPIVAFYWLAPPLLIGMYIYFHIYLQRQWDVLAQQPAITVDGTHLDRRIHGWIVLGLIRKHLKQLNERPPWF